MDKLIKITIGNSYSNIAGLSAKQEKELREALSYTVGGKSSYFSRFGPKRKSLLDKKGNFPSGLVPRVYNTLAGMIEPDQGVHSDFLSTDVTPQFNTVPNPNQYYKWQKQAVNDAMIWSRGIISAPTGSGKSKCMELLCLVSGLKTLIVVPTVEIKKQLTATLGKLNTVINNITIENIDSPALKTLTDFDCLIIDEAHHSAAKTYQKLNKTAWTGINHRFFFTATPFRNDTDETLLFEAIAGNIIYELTYQEAVENKYIVPVEAYYIEVPKQKTEAYTYAQVYSELVVNNEDRNNAIGALLLRLNSQQLPSLCLVKEVAHGRLLSSLTGIPFVCGEDDESRAFIQQFNKGEIKALIGTTGVLGEGIDTKPCEYVIVAGLGKAKSQFMQQVGRSLRNMPGKESGKVIIIKDKSHKFTRSHFRTQCDILTTEYGVTPLKLEI